MTEEQALALIEAIQAPKVSDVEQMHRDGESAFVLRRELEGSFDAETCRAILDCLDCRTRFAQKFREADQWLLTRQAAEQATHWRIADWRARELNGPVLEVGCGVGGDSIFLAGKTELTCFEMDPARAHLARANIRTFGETAEVLAGRADLSKLEGSTLFCDPARRARVRLSSPEDWVPSLSSVGDCYLSGRFEKVVIKVAPGIKEDALQGLEDPQLTFLSVDGDLKEAQLCLSKEIGGSQAVLLLNNNETLTYRDSGSELAIDNPKPGWFLHNPDPAILRARALNALGDELSAALVHPKIGYLVGPQASATRAADSFQIVDTFGLNWSKLKKWFKQSDWTDFEYLGRGVPFSQPEVRKRLPKLKPKDAPNRGSLIIYRKSEGYQAVLALRCENS